MIYTCEIDIDLPRARVVALFDNPDNLKHWQDGLISFTHKSGVPGQVGSTSDIVFQMGRRRAEMLETIQTRNLPGEFSAVYEVKGMWNLNSNYFTDNGASTQWRQVNEMRGTNLMLRLMVRLMPGMFKKQSLKFMVAFKAFAEAAEREAGSLKP